MKILKTVMLATVLLLVPVYAHSANPGYMRISLTEGDIQIKTPEAGDWGIASINSPVGEGDQVWAPQGGRVELQLNSGTYIRLSENSALQILSMDKDSSQFYLSQGNAYIYYGASGGSVIQVDTPDASTRAFEKTIFRIDMSDQYTEVAVYKGYVETENKVGNTRINAGQMLSLGQNTDGEVAPMGPSDDWETWNKTRNDRIFARSSASSGYLHGELSAYSYDFDNSGRWVDVPDYGHVWTPTVGVGASWSPYRDGRWIWRGGDYVWVGSESWGWAPYHYGRWSFQKSIGWFWVPPVAREVYWSPGYVGWVRTADYVAWVPLSPGETYYGRGNYGRNSVNITNVNINQVKITNVYKNVNVNNGVMIINRNTFATASPRIVNVNQNIIQQQIFIKNNISIGTPAIKPTRESYFASARPVAQAKLPPQAVKNILTTQLKQSRPFIKEAGKSVLNPGIKSKPLPVNTVTTPRSPGKVRPMIQQVKPAVGTGGAQGGPTGRGEKQQLKPVEKVKPAAPEARPHGKREDQSPMPLDRKRITPESGSGDRGEKQQVKPVERMKPSAPAGSPADRDEKQQLKPVVKKPAVSVVGPAPKSEKPLVKPVEKVKPAAPEARPPARGQSQQVKPIEKVKPAAPEARPPARGQSQQVKPVEKVKPAAPEARPPARGQSQQVKPIEKVKPAAPEARPPARGQSQQVKPVEKVKPAAPEARPPARGQSQQVKPVEKIKPAAPESGHEKKDQKKTDELDESPHKRQ